MGRIPSSKLEAVKNLYYKEGHSMRLVAEFLKVPMDSVVYFMRHHGLKRRTFSEEQRLRFSRKKPSFRLQKLTPRLRELKAVGTMLYWAEGHKQIEKNSAIDFANSDPLMIKIFMEFLRKVCGVDESRLRVHLYCYSDQDVFKLKRFWSKLTGIKLSQFGKAYVRYDYRTGGKKMIHGLVHIRYCDKKLLLEIVRGIDYYCRKHAPVV